MLENCYSNHKRSGILVLLSLRLFWYLQATYNVAVLAVLLLDLSSGAGEGQGRSGCFWVERVIELPDSMNLEPFREKGCHLRCIVLAAVT